MSFVVLGVLLAAPVLLFAQEGPVPTTRPGGQDERKARERAIARARALLRAKLGAAAASKATVESAEAATWPDTALGCPEKDRMYAQMLTRGWAVILKAGSARHEVHVSGSRAVLCREKGRDLIH